MASSTKTARPPYGTQAAIDACRAHRPTPQVNLETGKATGKIGCWSCGADLSNLVPLR